MRWKSFGSISKLRNHINVWFELKHENMMRIDFRIALLLNFQQKQTKIDRYYKKDTKLSEKSEVKMSIPIDVDSFHS